MNTSKFEVRGLNQERAFNILSKEVKIFKIERLQYNLSTFEVECREEKRVREILERNNLEVQLLSRHGLKKKLKNLFSCYGIIVGVIISIIFYLLQSPFILKIQVYGNQNLSAYEVQTYARGLIGNGFKKGIDSQKIANQIKSEFALASSVSVAIVGQTLIINLNEGILPSEMQGEFLPIVSEFDGLVSKITLIQGTLNVGVGDVVRKGDVLVFPYIIDADGEKRDVQPRADIQADVWIEREYCHKDYVIKTQRTGKKIVQNRVLLCGKEIYNHRQRGNFEEFEVEQKVENLVLNNLIPFKVEKTTYFELERIEINMPFEENKEEIIDLARQNVLIFLQKNEIIKEEKYFLKNGGGCYFIDYIITVSRNIGG